MTPFDPEPRAGDRKLGLVVLLGWYAIAVVAFLRWVPTVPDVAPYDGPCSGFGCGFSPRDGVILSAVLVVGLGGVVSLVVALLVLVIVTTGRFRSSVLAGTAAAAASLAALPAVATMLAGHGIDRIRERVWRGRSAEVSPGDSGAGLILRFLFVLLPGWTYCGVVALLLLGLFHQPEWMSIAGYRPTGGAYGAGLAVAIALPVVGAVAAAAVATRRAIRGDGTWEWLSGGVAVPVCALSLLGLGWTAHRDEPEPPSAPYIIRS